MEQILRTILLKERRKISFDCAFIFIFHHLKWAVGQQINQNLNTEIQ